MVHYPVTHHNESIWQSNTACFMAKKQDSKRKGPGSYSSPYRHRTGELKTFPKSPALKSSPITKHHHAVNKPLTNTT